MHYFIHTTLLLIQHQDSDDKFIQISFYSHILLYSRNFRFDHSIDIIHPTKLHLEELISQMAMQLYVQCGDKKFAYIDIGFQELSVSQWYIRMLRNCLLGQLVIGEIVRKSNFSGITGEMVRKEYCQLNPNYRSVQWMNFNYEA